MPCSFAAAAVGDDVGSDHAGPRLGVEAYHLDYDADGTASRMSGVEFYGGARGTWWTVRAVIPAIRLDGDSDVVAMGPGAGPLGSRRGGQETGTGPKAAGIEPGGSVGRSGLGDVRLTAALRLGRETSVGSWWARGGAKAPTADPDEGLGTGRWDHWAGLGWFREGWITTLDAFIQWVHLGDPLEVDLQDGLEGAMFGEWPVGRLAIGIGVEATSAGVAGDPVRVLASGYLRGPAGGRSSWEVEILAGLTENAPRLGIGGAWRY